MTPATAIKCALLAILVSVAGAQNTTVVLAHRDLGGWMMKHVWVGKLEVTQMPGEQLITISQGAAFTWFTCWAESAEGFESKAVDVMRYYGLHVVGFEEVSLGSDRVGVQGELLEQLERTSEVETHTLYGTFHTYPPRYS